MSVAGVLDVDGTLAARWSLGFEDLALLNAKPVGTRLGFAAQLLMYRTTGRFGLAASEFPGAAIAYLAEQIGATAADLAGYDWLAPDAATAPKSWLTSGSAEPGSRTCAMQPPGPGPTCVRWDCRHPS